MRIIEHEEVHAFRERATPLLMHDECVNCVMLGIIGRLAEGKAATRSGEVTVPLLMTVEDGDDVLAVATQTPPHALLFTPLDEPCANVIADHLHARAWDGFMFSGIVPSVHRIAGRWKQLTGRDYKPHIALKLFRTSRVIDPRPAPGELRLAARDDLPTVTDWIGAFGREINEPFPSASRTAEMATDEGRLHVWTVDGEPRSICAWQGPTPSSIRIGMVYTPAEFRGRGYASNAVAELTRRLLGSGRKYCTLFTDRSNPTSNSVYTKIGYEPVADFEHVTFVGAA
jgi:predicted GNAT family acetyltransferase